MLCNKVMLLFFTLFFLPLSLFAESVCSLTDSDQTRYIREIPDFVGRAKGKVNGILKGETFFKLLKPTEGENQEPDTFKIQIVNESDTPLIGWIYNPPGQNVFQMADGSGPCEMHEEEDTEADAPCDDCQEAQAPPPTVGNLDALTDIQEQIIAQSEQAPASPTSIVYDEKDAALVSKYENAEETLNTIIAATKIKRRSGEGMCYRRVKELLMCKVHNRRANCLLDEYIDSRKAKNAIRDLKNRGFINLLDPDEERMSSEQHQAESEALFARVEELKKQYNNLRKEKPRTAKKLLQEAEDLLSSSTDMKRNFENSKYKHLIENPELAPKGSILVYEGEPPNAAPCAPDSTDALRSTCGHVEIKTGGPGEPSYVSDYKRDTPSLRSVNKHYRLIGVMIKGEE